MEENKNKSKSNMKNTWILVTVLVIVTGVLLIISLKSKNAPTQPTKAEQTKINPAGSILMISDQVRVGSVSGTFNADVNLDSKNNKITAVQLEISYDPKILTKVDISPGTLIPDPVILAKNIDTRSGKIKYWISVRPDEAGIGGNGSVAVISFFKSGDAPTFINFLPKTSLSAVGTDKSVLKQMISGKIATLPSIIKATGSGKLSFPTKTP